jgi:hypothetical protein
VARRRIIAIAIYGFIAGGLLAYSLTYRAPPRAHENTMFAYQQQTFVSTRTIATTRQVHSLEFWTSGGGIEVAWYDSALSSLAADAGIYATLYIDGQQITNTLTGADTGLADKQPGMLEWAGPLPAGRHRFAVDLIPLNGGAQAPYVSPDHVGVDNLVVTQVARDG